MRDRVAACGGSLTCGPTAAGGWQVSALLPADPG
jgi:signal transduction histidine kinase